jgi:capsular exopolysaccharide synthesis family protein
MRAVTSRRAVGLAARSALLVIFAVVVAAAVALVLSLLSTSRYRATAEVLVGADADGVELLVASSSELVAEARAVVGDEPELSVEAAGDVLHFTASSTNADDAAAAANAYADVYVSWAPGTQVVGRAVAPSDPYEPDVARSVLLAALAGLVIGVVAALLVAWRGAATRPERRLTKATGLANLAVIPRHLQDAVAADGVVVLREPHSIESEAYRSLQTALDSVARDRPFTVLMVTSPRPDEATSSVAANVAATVAQSGRRVVLIDGDLRSPRVHRLFGLGNELGLSSVVAGDAPLRHCVQRLDVDRNVALLTAGPLPSDPVELLSHERMRRTVESLAGASDLVVIDAPPVLPVTDSVVLAQLADAALLVATEGHTYRREWIEALERLRGVDADVIGTVLLRPDSRVTSGADAASLGSDADDGQVDDAAVDGPPEEMAVDGQAPEVISAPAGERAATNPPSWGRPVASLRLAWPDPGDRGVTDGDHRAG